MFRVVEGVSKSGRVGVQERERWIGPKQTGIPQAACPSSRQPSATSHHDGVDIAKTSPGCGPPALHYDWSPVAHRYGHLPAAHCGRGNRGRIHR